MIKKYLLGMALVAMTAVPSMASFVFSDSFNTDGPEMLQTTLRDELKLAVRANLVSREELAQCGQWAREASFLLRGRA